MRRLATWVLVMSVLGPGAFAAAQDGPSAPDAETVAAARAAFDEGNDAFDDGQPALAVDAFMRANALVERAASHRNLARALLQLTRFVEARDAFVRCAEIAADEHRAAVCEQGRARAEGHIARLTLRVTPVDATVEVDGRPVEGSGGTRSIELDEGTHRVSVFVPGHARWAEAIELDGDAERELSVELESTRVLAPEPSVAPEAGVPPVAEPPADSPDFMTGGVAALVAGGAVSVAGAITLALGYAAGSRVQDLPMGDAWSTVEGDYENAQVFTGVGWVLLPLGVAVATLGVVLIAVEPGEAEVAVGPGHVTVRGRF
ncbi:MAG: PEGA domain-containing protein [Sandaracinaceae bacterium]